MDTSATPVPTAPKNDKFFYNLLVTLVVILSLIAASISKNSPLGVYVVIGLIIISLLHSISKRKETGFSKIHWLAIWTILASWLARGILPVHLTAGDYLSYIVIIFWVSYFLFRMFKKKYGDQNPTITGTILKYDSGSLESDEALIYKTIPRQAFVTVYLTMLAVGYPRSSHEFDLTPGLYIVLGFFLLLMSYIVFDIYLSILRKKVLKPLPHKFLIVLPMVIFFTLMYLVTKA